MEDYKISKRKKKLKKQYWESAMWKELKSQKRCHQEAYCHSPVRLPLDGVQPHPLWLLQPSALIACTLMRRVYGLEDFVLQMLIRVRKGHLALINIHELQKNNQEPSSRSWTLLKYHTSESLGTVIWLWGKTLQGNLKAFRPGERVTHMTIEF